MGCGTKLAKKLLLVLLSLLKVLVAVAIIVIVTEKLYDVGLGGSGTDTRVTASCLLGKNIDEHALCIYAYAVSGVSIIVSALISLLLCCTCNLCGIGGLVEVLLAIVGTGWWTAAAIVFNKYGLEANDLSVPEQDARVTVIVLCWVEVALFGATVLVALVTAVNCLRKCLCCCCPDDDDNDRRK